MSEPEYLSMGERGWIVEAGWVDIGVFNLAPGAIIRTETGRITPILLPSTKLYPIEDEL